VTINEEHFAFLEDAVGEIEKRIEARAKELTLMRQIIDEPEMENVSCTFLELVFS